MISFTLIWAPSFGHSPPQSSAPTDTPGTSAPFNSPINAEGFDTVSSDAYDAEVDVVVPLVYTATT